MLKSTRDETVSCCTSGISLTAKRATHTRSTCLEQLNTVLILVFVVSCERSCPDGELLPEWRTHQREVAESSEPQRVGSDEKGEKKRATQASVLAMPKMCMSRMPKDLHVALV